jgi:diadenylate cyclase
MFLLDEVIETVSTLAESFDPVRDTIDIAIVALALYWALLVMKGTRAKQMLLGLGALVLVWAISIPTGLATVNFILDYTFSWGVLIVIVIFQRDIRRALTQVGLGIFSQPSGVGLHAVEEIVRACQALRQSRVGALLVLQRDVELEEHMELGARIDAVLSRDLLVALFLPSSPLHDGAVIVHEGRIAAARCILPLALAPDLSPALGTRHRAALGIGEESDALAVVVSEETGRISLVDGKEIFQGLDGPSLRGHLLRRLGLAKEEPATAGDEETGVPARSEAT